MQEGFPTIVNVADALIHLHRMGVLEPLLADKTTGGNILWATDAYAERGPQYEPTAEITASLITGPDYAGIIQTRARKAFEQQSARTRQRAEVYTPLWVVKMMCNHIDEVWFKRKDGFSKTIPETNHVYFNKNRTWTAYVKSTRLEITCGEGPYLASRYDAPTGVVIPIRERTGLLDRKLRVIGENVDNEADWLKWAKRAFQSVYGFEYQGDSLLIARVNALMTFSEYFSDRWGHLPKPHEYHTIAEIITWNLWEMDGLSGTVPYRTLEKYPQIFIDGWTVSQVSLSDKPKQCIIYDWRKHCEVEYSSLREKGAESMKFDFVIGNPPYNQEAQKTSTSDDPIYNYFMDSAYEISNRVILISPARFLMNAGKTPSKWNLKMLNDEHLKVVYYEGNSQNVFPSALIPGGIAVTYRDSTKVFGAIEHFIYYPELTEINRKVSGYGEPSLNRIMYNQSKFNLPMVYKDYPEMQKLIGSNGKDKRFRQIVLERFPQLFRESESEDCLHILGLVKRQRAYRYIKRCYVEEETWIDKYKVFVPFSNGASGTLGSEPARLISRPVLGYPKDGITQTFIGVGSFDTEYEAKNCERYILSKFARVLLGILKVTQGNKPETWRFVPVQDFTAKSDINWNKSASEIDQQLYAKYGLSEEEIAFIESHVKAME